MNKLIIEIIALVCMCHCGLSQDNSDNGRIVYRDKSNLPWWQYKRNSDATWRQYIVETNDNQQIPEVSGNALRPIKPQGPQKTRAADHHTAKVVALWFVAIATLKGVMAILKGILSFFKKDK